ncbi:inositol polyphosphate multikinase beta-like [Vigna angularis]|nr:inositol polyphosphate multikinase beta-like [Vigna angularis]
MLKVPEHQVAGHMAKNGVLGPLVDDSGKFYKPLQDNDRGSAELSFYTSLAVPPSIRPFFPAFHGTAVVPASDGSGPHTHLLLQDLIAPYTKPSVMDVKIGSRTWHLGHSEDYIAKSLSKDRTTSTIPLAFRITGVKDSLSSWEPSRTFLQTLSAEGVALVLRKFVSSSNSDDSRSDPDCDFAAEVFGAVLERLVELKAWFEVQTLYHFYSCSVLVVYEKEKGNAKPLVKLVDFAHVVSGNGVIDHNFLGGLCSFINFIRNILQALHQNNCKIVSGQGVHVTIYTISEI